MRNYIDKMEQKRALAYHETRVIREIEFNDMTLEELNEMIIIEEGPSQDLYDIKKEIELEIAFEEMLERDYLDEIAIEKYLNEIL